MKWGPAFAYLSLVSLCLGSPALAPKAAQGDTQPECGIPEGAGTRGVPISQFLRPDGTLNLPAEGIEGSLDTSGFQLVEGPGGEPRFERERGGPAPDAIDRTEAAGDECWDALFSPRTVTSTVRALAWDGTNLYAAGSFSAAGGVLANNIAKWNGTAWSALGSGLSDPSFAVVYALAWTGADLYVGGRFTTAGGTSANHVARWDGSSWSALGTGMGGGLVYALAWDGTSLYAGGSFTTAGGLSAPRVARWSSSIWTSLGAGTNDEVYALAWAGGTLYAGGIFTTAGGGSAARIARWNGTAWSQLSTGMNGAVRALAWDGTNLYAGGAFTTAGGSPANRVARWNGTAWSALGTGLASQVNSLAWDGANLCAGADSGLITKWGGASWIPLGSAADSNVYALAATGGALCAGGSFQLVAGIPAPRAARWDGTSWGALGIAGEGASDSVRALAWDGTNLYAGGTFKVVGGTAANYVARWDGSLWSALGAGTNSSVSALAWDGANLYAGGGFTMAGGASANRVAKWDGAAWSALGTGMNGNVNALAWGGGTLYAGGSFTTADGAAASFVAKWDGVAWSPLGSGMDSQVYALALGGGVLYAGGVFSTAGGISASHVASWDGIAWSALGSGVSNTVRALSWSGSHLYVGGEFTAAGGSPASYVARWNGSSWAPLGAGVSWNVTSLSWNGTDLYAGGQFTAAGGTPANYVARWDGTGWSGLGSGVNNAPGLPLSVMCMAVDGTSLYSGGLFSSGGLSPSSNIARWVPPASFVSHPFNQSTCIGGNASFSVTATGQGLTYQWQEDSGSGFANLSDGGMYAGTAAATLSLTGVTAGMNGYAYRCLVTGSCGPSAASNAATLTLTALSPAISGPSAGCASVALSTGSYTTYQWYLDGNPISGAISQNYTATASGSYTVTVTGAGGCSGTSAPHIVSITAPFAGWAVTGPSGLYIQTRALAADPVTPGTLYAGGYPGGVYKTLDRGGTWTLAGLSTRYIHGIAIDPSAPSVIYAATDGAGMFKSTDGGGSWAAINAGLTGLYVYPVVLDPSTPSTLYVGTYFGSGVFKSTDAGGTWTQVSAGLTSQAVFALAIDPADPAKIYAGTYDCTYCGGHLYRSSNGGANWTAIASFSQPVQAILVDADDPDILFVGAGGWGGAGVFRSDDAGATWSPLNSGLTDTTVHALARSTHDPDEMYAGTIGGGGVFRTVDGGATWASVTSGLPNTQNFALQIDPHQPSTVYAGTNGHGVCRRPFGSVSGPNAICLGQSATLDAGPGYSSYLWSTGAISRTITVSPSATTTYTVTVTDAGTCSTATESHLLHVGGEPSSLSGGATNECPAATVTLSAGAGYASYQWYKDGIPLAGENGPSLSITANGIYRVRTADTYGCEGDSEDRRVILQRCVQPCDGWTWANPLPDGKSLHGVAYRASDDLYVAVGQAGTILLSSDALAWYPQESGTTVDLLGVADSGSLFVAVGASGAILTSPDGATWTPRTSGFTTGIMGVRHMNGAFYAVGWGQAVLRSPDGITWSTVFTGDAGSYLSDIAWSGSTFVACGADFSLYHGSGVTMAALLTSPDGVTWSYQTLDITSYVSGAGPNGVAWNGTAFVVVGDEGVVLRSPDGLAWTVAQLPQRTWMNSVAWDGGQFGVVGLGQSQASPDGITWTAKPFDAYYLYRVLHDGTNFVAVGEGGVALWGTDPSPWTRGGSAGPVKDHFRSVVGGDPVAGKPAVAVAFDEGSGAAISWSSPDGSTWTRSSTTLPGSFPFACLSYGYGEYLAGGNGAFAKSLDGSVWTAQTPPSHNFTGISGDGPTVVGVGPLGAISTLPLLSSGAWTARTSGTTNRLRSVAWNGHLALYCAVGDAGTLLTSPDGINWTPRASGVTQHLLAVAASGTHAVSGEPVAVQFLVVGTYGTILTSADGTSWTARTPPVGWTLRGAAWAGTQFFAFTPFGGILSSPDGVTWAVEKAGAMPSAMALRPAVAPGTPGRVVGVGYYGALFHKAQLLPGASATVHSGAVPFLANFSSSPAGGAGTYTAYDWDFGDGSPHDSSQSPTHSYASPGIYTATLTVTDCHGAVVRQTLSLRATSTLRVPHSSVPLTVVKRAAGQMNLGWDAATCPSAGYHLIYGSGSSLPSWTVSGGVCALGTTGFATVPSIGDPSLDASRFLWFLVVGDDGVGTEGSWGLTSTGAERGAGPSGSCGFASRTTYACATP